MLSCPAVFARLWRKLAEAREAMALRGRMLMLMMLLRTRSRSYCHRGDLATVMAASADDEALFLRLLRKHGHAANEAGDIDAAQLWFDCAHAASRSSRDPLSAVNMRTKLVPGSPAAAAPLHPISLPAGAVEEDELRIAHRSWRCCASSVTPRGSHRHSTRDVDEDDEEADRSPARRRCAGRMSNAQIACGLVGSGESEELKASGRRGRGNPLGRPRSFHRSPAAARAQSRWGRGRCRRTTQPSAVTRMVVGGGRRREQPAGECDRRCSQVISAITETCYAQDEA